jgi:beta-phosphoglucomutase-like phosphatase (HAD superfamily)
MPNIREGETRVGTYEREDGTVVHSHPTHYQHGTPIFIVLYRGKNLRESGGSRAHPKNKRFKWHIAGKFKSDSAAERKRKSLMAEGYHAIIEKVGGRDKMPSLKELVEDVEHRDRDVRAMRME